MNDITLLRVKNNQPIKLDEILIMDYSDFYRVSLDLLNCGDRHCANYFAFKRHGDLQFIMAIADDKEQDIIVLSHILRDTDKRELKSLTSENFALHIFEREICENFGIAFSGHPWLKPLRFAADCSGKKAAINDYPFYSIKSEELHEVGVGPIHAGIIEPGHFRFICNGENVLHLEIQLGWQHRGVEKLFIDKKHYLQKNLLAENIAGDTAIAHAATYAQAIESLAGKTVPEQLEIERALAMELERIAIHTCDISALCVDSAYHLGANVFGILRTAIINFLQFWCGNRFGKSLVRTCGTNFPFTEPLKQELLEVLAKFEKMFDEMAEQTYQMPSIQNRFDSIGILTKQQALAIGTVGLSARVSGINRDIRQSHPNIAQQKFPYEGVVKEAGDVLARFELKREEIKKSIEWIRHIMSAYTFDSKETQNPIYELELAKSSLVISLNEAWRGEVCHCAISDDNGELLHYKIKDPSIHNWKALELSLRNCEISDFPINNKSYNLSYCGHDL